MARTEQREQHGKFGVTWFNRSDMATVDFGELGEVEQELLTQFLCEENVQVRIFVSSLEVSDSRGSCIM